MLNLLPRLVGGFIQLWERVYVGDKIKKKYIVHVISFIVCKGKLIACDSNYKSCTGADDVALISPENNMYRINYVFTPADKIGPAQFTNAAVRQMKTFELRKRSDYAPYSGNLRRMIQYHNQMLDIQGDLDQMLDGLSVRTKLGRAGSIISVRNDKATVAFRGEGAETFHVDDLTHVPYAERIFNPPPMLPSDRAPYFGNFLAMRKKDPRMLDYLAVRTQAGERGFISGRPGARRDANWVEVVTAHGTSSVMIDTLTQVPYAERAREEIEALAM